VSFIAKQKTWVLTTNNRISFVSLNDTMARYLFGMKTFLKANGYTVAGSSNGTTGAMDASDRWITFSNVTTQGANSASAQSWIVLTDANGVQILLAFQGGTANIARISFSPGALFVAAGTPQNQPTATDEQLLATTPDLINSTASGDRVWFGWVDSTSKLCRFAIARSGVFTGQTWGIELVSPVVSGSGVSWTPAVWGFMLPVATDNYGTGANVGVARPSTASTARNAVVVFAAEMLGNLTSNDAICSRKATLQGNLGIPTIPLGIASNTTNAKGKLGNLFDTWLGRSTGGKDGDLVDSRAFIGVAGYRANLGGGLWPWDGVTTPQLY
jgi:hypothetical protein